MGINKGYKILEEIIQITIIKEKLRLKHTKRTLCINFLIVNI
jgi:hypothetical protein